MDTNKAVWQDLRPRKRMEHLLSTGHLSDCSFVVFDQGDDETKQKKKMILKCHKFVLMVASPVFERMFDGDFQESQSSDNITLDDVSASHFKMFLEFLYWRDKTNLDNCDLGELQNLIYLSKKFMVQYLTTDCIANIAKRLRTEWNTNIVVDLYHYADKIDETQLLTHVKKKIHSNPIAYMTTTAVYELTKDTFVKFITEFNDISVAERFKVIDRYCQIHKLDAYNTNNETIPFDIKLVKDESHSNNDDGDAKNSQEKEEKSLNKVKNYANDSIYVTKLLSTINMQSMSSHEFSNGPGKSKLLSVETKYETLTAICENEFKNRELHFKKNVQPTPFENLKKTNKPTPFNFQLQK